MNFRDVTQPIAEAIGITYDAPVDEVLTANLDSDGIVFGQLMSGGNFYHYIADADEIITYYLPEETEYLNDYTHAVLDNIGIHTDAWDTYAYAQGFFRLDAQLKCKPGNKPCGQRCIPQAAKCRKAMGGAAQGAMRQGRVNLRSPGVGAIAAGVVGAAALAAAGAAAHHNREAIGKAAGQAGRHAEKMAAVAKNEVEGKAAELHYNVKKGVDKAKEHIQEAANQTGKAAQKAGKQATVAMKRVQKEVDGHVTNAKKGLEEMDKRTQQQTRKNQKREKRFANSVGYTAKVGERLANRVTRKLGAK